MRQIQIIAFPMLATRFMPLKNRSQAPSVAIKERHFTRESYVRIVIIEE